jgi:catechol 2,3-dioxygenase-like lactoylglutathione lyase family enzyme
VCGLGDHLAVDPGRPPDGTGTGRRRLCAGHHRAPYRLAGAGPGPEPCSTWAPCGIVYNASEIRALWELYVHTDACAGLHQQAVDAGHESLVPPRRLDRGPVTVAFVRDPDGHQVELVQRHAG